MDGGKFFGAYRASSGITDAVVLNHVPVGCNWGAAMFKTSLNQLDMRHACTVIHEREIVFGGEEALQKALIQADKLYDTPLIVVIAGDAPLIIGDDVEAVINSVQLNREVTWVEAAGFKGSMKDGYEESLIHLSNLMRECDTVKNSVNLIGFHLDDFKVDADIKELTRILEYAEVTVNCIISKCRFEEFIQAPAAELNVVLGQGTGLAEHMKKEFGIPYINIDYPYGLDATEEFINSICAQLGTDARQEPDLDPFKKIYLYLHELYGSPASIIGDFHLGSMASFLEGELGFNMEVISSFEDDYYDFEDKVINSNTTILFGSSFERNIAKRLNIPLMRYCYPMFDSVCIYDDAPYAGFRGAVNLSEQIINSIMTSVIN